jgi:hypothetical protein
MESTYLPNPTSLSNWSKNFEYFDDNDLNNMANNYATYGVANNAIGDAAKASWLQDLLTPVGGFSGFKDLAGGIGSLGNMWLSSQALDLAKKNSDAQIGAMKANLYNTAQGFNATLGDRARYQASVYGNADPNSQAYKDTYNNYYNQYKAKDTI